MNSDIRSKIQRLFARRPDLNKSLIVTGKISDSKELIDWYKRASVFVLTSRYESSGIVLIEALFNGDYIISTDVGCVRDIVKGEENCHICPKLKRTMQDGTKIEKDLKQVLDKLIYEEINPIAEIY